MAVYTQLTTLDFQQILARYNLRFIRAKEIESGASNSNYDVMTDQGRLILTLFHEINHGRVIGLETLLTHLDQHNFPTSKLCYTTDQQGTITHKGYPILLKHYIDGEMPTAVTTPIRHQLGRALAQLHQLPIPSKTPETNTYGAPYFELAQNQTIDLEFRHWCRDWFANNYPKLPADLPTSLIHGDLFDDNTLFQDGTLHAIIDFENSFIFYSVFDLAMTIVGLYDEAQTIEEQARPLLAGYEEIRPLLAEEKDSLSLWVSYAAVSVACWRFWKYNIDFTWPKRANSHWDMVKIA